MLWPALVRTVSFPDTVTQWEPTLDISEPPGGVAHSRAGASAPDFYTLVAGMRQTVTTSGFVSGPTLWDELFLYNFFSVFINKREMVGRLRCPISALMSTQCLCRCYESVVLQGWRSLITCGQCRRPSPLCPGAHMVPPLPA